MEKRKHYCNTIFKPEILVEAGGVFNRFWDGKTNIYTNLEISFGSEGWKYDNEEEFFSDYRKGPESATRGGRVCLDSLKLFLSGKLPVFMPLPVPVA